MGVCSFGGKGSKGRGVHECHFQDWKREIKLNMRGGVMACESCKGGTSVVMLIFFIFFVIQ